MTKVSSILKGASIFLIGYITVIILNTFIPPLITALTGIFTDADLTGIINFALIILYTTIILILPHYYIIQGLTTQTNNKTNAITGAAIFLFSLLLTVFGWYWAPALAGLTNDTFVIALYWIGFLTIWAQITIITPAYLIIKSYK